MAPLRAHLRNLTGANLGGWIASRYVTPAPRGGGRSLASPCLRGALHTSAGLFFPSSPSVLGRWPSEESLLARWSISGDGRESAAAYRVVERIEYQREGRVHDYFAKRGVDEIFVLTPKDAPS
nr:MobA/MobL family protein [Pacificoceanicola onchidii]